jgi:hypothetical protein
VLERTLRALVEAGASVAWCGLEGYFADPPLLFDPAQMSGGVFASYAPSLGFKCASQLDGPLVALADSELRDLASLL